MPKNPHKTSCTCDRGFLDQPKNPQHEQRLHVPADFWTCPKIRCATSCTCDRGFLDPPKNPRLWKRLEPDSKERERFDFGIGFRPIPKIARTFQLWNRLLTDSKKRERTQIWSRNVSATSAHLSLESALRRFHWQMSLLFAWRIFG